MIISIVIINEWCSKRRQFGYVYVVFYCTARIHTIWVGKLRTRARMLMKIFFGEKFFKFGDNIFENEIP